jgi:multidrug resistance protein MdtO
VAISTAASIFAFVIGGGIPLWDRRLSAETNVEDTLRLLLSVLIGVIVTAGVEFAFVRLRTGDEALLLIARRLSAVEKLLNGYAENRAPDANCTQAVLRLQMLGTSLLRRTLGGAARSSAYSATMAGVAVLVGRVIDLAAALTHLSFEPSPTDQSRFRTLASIIASIRNDLISPQGSWPGPDPYR